MFQVAQPDVDTALATRTEVAKPDPFERGHTAAGATATPDTDASNKPVPEKEQHLTLQAYQSVIGMEDRLVFTVFDTSYRGRSDLIGARLNGKEVRMEVGDSVLVNSSDAYCVITLMSINRSQQNATFLYQCGPLASAPKRIFQLQAGVPAALSSSERFEMKGGQSKLIEGTVVAMLKTPFRGRRDLVGINLDGKETRLSIGERFSIAGESKACTLTLTNIHFGKNTAGYLLACDG